MYLFSGIVLVLLLLLLYCIRKHRKKVIQKISSMSLTQKNSLLNELARPFGLSYEPSQDLFTFRVNTWQQTPGYTAAYDQSAWRLLFILNCLPIYFDYGNQTWLIEIRKGQYGIYTGADIGVYHVDRVLDKKEYDTACFQSASDSENLTLSFQLYKNGSLIADRTNPYWWLTAFRIGCFSPLKDLCMRASILFPNPEMAQAFTDSLSQIGYRSREILFYERTVSFPFSQHFVHNQLITRFLFFCAMKYNQFLCFLFLFVTKPFCLSADRLLYLYYHLPFAFQKVMYFYEQSPAAHTIRKKR